MAWVDKLRERVCGISPWDPGKISDEWFRIHFEYAADITHQWIGGVLDVKQARLLQFGCGDSVTDLGIVLRHGARSIHCVDVMEGYRKLAGVAQSQLGLARLPAALSFQTIQAGEKLAGQQPLYDGIMSWSVFEHVSREQVLAILLDLYQCLKPGGYFFLQIEPLYYSAYGSHLRRFSEVPWHHLLVSDEELWRTVQEHQNEIKADEADLALEDLGMDNYKRYIFSEYQLLNKLTADELVSLISQAGFEILREKRGNVEQSGPIPEVLLQRFSRDVLVNNEIFLLMQRPV